MLRIKTIQDVDDALQILTARDPDLARILQYVSDAGTKVPLRLRAEGFGGLAEIVIAQLVSKASANAIYARFQQHISPMSPDTYLEAGEETWRKIGLSRPKQATFSAISTAIISGELDLARLGELPAQEAISHLSAIKGIGPWTAQVYLLFCLGHRDIFPAGDLALREAARLIWSMPQRPPEAELKIIARRWAPWRGVAARLLWTYYAVSKNAAEVIP